MASLLQIAVGALAGRQQKQEREKDEAERKADRATRDMMTRLQLLRMPGVSLSDPSTLVPPDQPAPTAQPSILGAAASAVQDGSEGVSTEQPVIARSSPEQPLRLPGITSDIPSVDPVEVGQFGDQTVTFDRSRTSQASLAKRQGSAYQQLDPETRGQFIEGVDYERRLEQQKGEARQEERREGERERQEQERTELAQRLLDQGLAESMEDAQLMAQGISVTSLRDQQRTTAAQADMEREAIAQADVMALQVLKSGQQGSSLGVELNNFRKALEAQFPLLPATTVRRIAALTVSRLEQLRAQEARLPGSGSTINLEGLLN